MTETEREARLTNPPAVLERIAGLFIPPPHRNDMLADLRDEYHDSPGVARYVRKAASSVRTMVSGRVADTFNGGLVFLQAVALFLAFFDWTHYRIVAAGVLVGVAVLVIRDVYGPSIGKLPDAFWDAAITVACVVASLIIAAILFPIGHLPTLTIMRGAAGSLLGISLLRALLRNPAARPPVEKAYRTVYRMNVMWVAALYLFSLACVAAGPSMLDALFGIAPMAIIGASIRGRRGALVPYSKDHYVPIVERGKTEMRRKWSLLWAPESRRLRYSFTALIVFRWVSSLFYPPLGRTPFGLQFGGGDHADRDFNRHRKGQPQSIAVASGSTPEIGGGGAMTAFRHNLMGNSAAMLKLVRQMVHAARNDSSVLICGETGTGKELVARAIHENSKRRNGPFVAVNCSAIPETLFESELFGHEKGSFTGAVNTKRGEFELAAGGTLFLDEIGELPLMMQPKLLRALQEREIKRLGAPRPIKTDVRIIAATHRDLRSGFRQDLYYRLHVIAIRTPSLRERPEDVAVLARHFVSMYAPQAGRDVTGISAAAELLLTAYDWPGNVRELQNVMEAAVMMGSSSEIIPEDLPDILPSVSLDFEVGVAAAKRNLLERAFTVAHGHLDTASALLNLNRNYVYNLLKKFNLVHLRRSSLDGKA